MADLQCISKFSNPQIFKFPKSPNFLFLYYFGAKAYENRLYISLPLRLLILKENMKRK